MSKSKTPTIKQKLAFSALLEAQANKQPVSMKGIMTKAGYSMASTINPELNLTSRPGWKQLMDAHFNDEAIAREIRDIAFGATDQRAKLAAIDMMLKLKGKYPINKLRLEGANNELNQILNDDITGNQISEEDKI